MINRALISQLKLVARASINQSTCSFKFTSSKRAFYDLENVRVLRRRRSKARRISKTRKNSSIFAKYRIRTEKFSNVHWHGTAPADWLDYFQIFDKKFLLLDFFISKIWIFTWRFWIRNYENLQIGDTWYVQVEKDTCQNYMYHFFLAGT